MAQRLKNILSFTDVGPGEAISIPHELNDGRIAQIPDLLLPSRPGFVWAADENEVIAVNATDEVASAKCYVELWHTFERSFGERQNLQEILPRPYIPSFGLGLSASDELVKVTSNDQEAQYLLEKLQAGTGISIMEKNDGGIERVEIRADAMPPTADEMVKISGNDQATDFLINKLVAGTGITLTEQNDGMFETLLIEALGTGASVRRTQYLAALVSTGGINFVSAMAGMPIVIPEDGDYAMFFEGEGVNGSGSGRLEIGIAINFANVPAGESLRTSGGNANDVRWVGTTQGFTGLSAGDSVFVSFRKAAGAGSVALIRRRLTIIKVKN